MCHGLFACLRVYCQEVAGLQFDTRLFRLRPENTTAQFCGFKLATKLKLCFGGVGWWLWVGVGVGVGGSDAEHFKPRSQSTTAEVQSLEIKSSFQCLDRA